MVDYYEDLNVHLQCINELLEMQEDRFLPPYTIKDTRKIILSNFSAKAKFIKECFLAFKNFESKEMIDLLPVILKFQNLVKVTKIDKKLTNSIPCIHPDSAHYQVLKLRELSAEHMESYRNETTTKFF